jgi:hypothetical protein
MKKIFYLIVLLIMGFPLLVRSQNALMPSYLIVNSRMPIDTYFNHAGYYSADSVFSIEKFLYCNVQLLYKKPFNELIIDGITKNGIAIFDGYDPVSLDIPQGKMNPELVKYRLGFSIDTVVVQELLTDTMTTIVHEIRYEDLSSVLFTEKWNFDADDYKMTKEVIAMTPLINKYNDDFYGDDNSFRGVMRAGSVFPKLQSKKNLVPLLKISYEFILGNTEQMRSRLMASEEDQWCSYLEVEKEDSPFWSSWSRSHFIDLLIDPVLNGKTKAYDYTTGAQMSIKDARTALGEGVDSVLIDDPTTGSQSVVAFKTDIDRSSVLTVIFEEEWFIEPNTLYLQKEIRSISPVIYKFDENGYKKVIPYRIKL